MLSTTTCAYIYNKSGTLIAPDRSSYVQPSPFPELNMFVVNYAYSGGKVLLDNQGKTYATQCYYCKETKS
jgi:hypothetical protein